MLMGSLVSGLADQVENVDDLPRKESLACERVDPFDGCVFIRRVNPVVLVDQLDHALAKNAEYHYRRARVRVEVGLGKGSQVLQRREVVREEREISHCGHLPYW